jgi:hypothetical protein
VRIEHADFLEARTSSFDFVVGNPPYVSILGLSEGERELYRSRFSTARGRFDLYLLFFEQSLRSLALNGRLVFITPEKYLYVDTARPLRCLMAKSHVEELRLLSEDTFPGLVTYPTITVVNNRAASSTTILSRDGSSLQVDLPLRGDRWWPPRESPEEEPAGPTLADLCVRISVGVATGADSVFVRRVDELPASLRRFAYPTVSGRELRPTTIEVPRSRVMLVPYDANGRLLPQEKLGSLGTYLGGDEVKRRLLARTCVRRKPWYAFHETPALREMLRPKILCKDIGSAPQFWVDRAGEIVPRHSVYYMVPREPRLIDSIVDYLRSPVAHRWLDRNCQRAAKGFLRLQSRALQRLPVPLSLAAEARTNRRAWATRLRAAQSELFVEAAP